MHTSIRNHFAVQAPSSGYLLRFYDEQLTSVDNEEFAFQRNGAGVVGTQGTLAAWAFASMAIGICAGHCHVNWNVQWCSWFWSCSDGSALGVDISGGSVERGNLTPDREAIGHHLSVVGRRQQVPTDPEMWRNAAERRQEPLGMPG